MQQQISAALVTGVKTLMQAGSKDHLQAQHQLLNPDNFTGKTLDKTTQITRPVLDHCV